MKKYTQRADGVKMDVCKGNSGQHSFFCQWPEKLVTGLIKSILLKEETDFIKPQLL